MTTTLWSSALDDGRPVRVLISDRTDGDLSVAASTDERRQQIAFGPWTWLRQVHGDRVVTVGEPGDHAGTAADASVASVDGATLAIQVADCMPVALVAPGVVGVAHAGWRGLANGIVESTLRAMRQLDASCEAAATTAVVGPSICAACYEFGEPELSQLVDRFSPEVRDTTSEGRPALNLHQAMTAELRRLGVGATVWGDDCTACHPDRFWSWRARQESGRQAMIVQIGHRE